MFIGFADLIATAILHQRGLIVELNPAMRPFIERSELLFCLIKASTLVAAWIVMARYARTNVEFVRTACTCGSILYLVVWTSWFVGAQMG